MIPVLTMDGKTRSYLRHRVDEERRLRAGGGGGLPFAAWVAADGDPSRALLLALAHNAARVVEGRRRTERRGAVAPPAP
jgi:hypothetical protein